uniref:Uncharacterized protein n=1 Tax=Knipowitschia caucasica TaxID=637954 RepID=A0AAV2KE70_KNICA
MCLQGSHCLIILPCPLHPNKRRLYQKPMPKTNCAPTFLKLDPAFARSGTCSRTPNTHSLFPPDLPPTSAHWIQPQSLTPRP